MHLDTTNIAKHLNRPVVLIGMMGTGKTHLGKMLAEALNLEFFDSDNVIEARGGLTINEIFELYGEDRFRQSEEKTILELLANGTCIIATGGGAPMNANIMNAIKQDSISIWLESDVDAIYERIKTAKNRPLLNNDDPKAILNALLKKREGTYAKADVTVNTHKNKPEAVISEIIEALGKLI